jgi:ribosomal protein S18 acetylase RimI-like enzyme
MFCFDRRKLKEEGFMKTNSDTDYLITNAESGDIPELIRMRILLQKHMEASNNKTLKYKKGLMFQLKKDYEAILRDENTKALIAIEKNTDHAIGMMVAHLNKHGYFKTTQSVQIEGVWVDYAYRNLGICKALLKEVVGHFKKKRVTFFTLDTVINNNEAEKTWLSLGFKPVMQNCIAKIEDLKI